MRASTTFLSLCLIIASSLQAQQWNYPAAGITTFSGNVGIGNAAPAEKLHVSGNVKIDAGNEIVFADNGQIRSLDPNHRILFRRSENIMEMREYGAIVFSPGAVNGTETAKMTLTSNGDLGIGTSDTKGYKLAVNGSGVFTKVTVKAYANWPDYVFHAKYRLRPLSEVEEYIQQHHHLPELASAEEVGKNGLDIGENQAALLKKIEELTLYIIQQNKQLAEQQQQINSLRMEVKEIRMVKKHE